MRDWTLTLGDCREVLPGIESGSVDLVFTDPPYPEISRSYGRWTEAEWWELMRAVVPECMRVLKPTGSAVFVLQPNSERVGRMRTWLWEFMLWAGRQWGVVQDVYWWNIAALPVGAAITAGLLRGSIKPCVWVGPGDCYRSQRSVLWGKGEWHKTRKAAARYGTVTHPGGHSVNHAAMLDVAARRGGVTPFNLLPVPNNRQGAGDDAGANGHGAGTPLPLCSWWVRYLCPPGGTVLDPFSGTATAGVAALAHGCRYAGIECVPEYHETARRRMADAQGPLFACAAEVPK